ncbi:MAG: hypothetical protein AB7R67_21865 [Vicinamibacterales bacterium]
MAFAATVTIGGSPRAWRAGTLHIVENVNRRSTLRVGITSRDGSYVPDVDDEVEVEDGSSNVLFGGLVRKPTEEWIEKTAALITDVEAWDYTALAERRLIAASVAAGLSGRDAIDAVIAGVLAVYGVTRDPGMPAGATLGELTYDFATAMQVLNDVVRLAAPAGWAWRIDEGKVLRAWEVGTEACPWAISPSSSKVAGGDFAITREVDYYANTVYLVYGDGTAENAVVSATDAGEVSANGPYDTVIRAKGPYDGTTAQAIVDAYLARLLQRPKQITFQTLEPGARAGMTLAVNFPARNLSGDYLITQVETRDIADGQHLLYSITASQGGTLPASWKDETGTSGGSASGAVTVGGTISVPVVGRSAYPLGGSLFAGEQSAGPSVVNAVSYQDVMLDTAAIGAGTSVTAVVTCRAATAGAKVTPQIYNVTTASVAGTGSQVTGTTPTTVAFPITVTPGQNVYRLRMTPDTANVDVFAQGYLEVGR